MDNVRPRASSFSPPKEFFNIRTVDRPKSPKPIIKSKWVKKESTAGTQAVLPQTKGEKGSVGNPEEELKDHAIIDSGCSGSMTGDKDKLSDFKEYKGETFASGLLTCLSSKALGKDEKGEDVIFQVTPKVSHMNAVKRIFRYLKHQPKLGLWYPKDSPFHLEAFSDSDYAGDNHDRRSTSGGCQYLGRRLVSCSARNKQL
ncbi:hypothetical protein Tco_0749113 [Tanacetum coccineum]|uniref:Uncharacterized protein n=1 Tax=Tanacetum coccineum TaxID=301880 RepID=A0ABQ4Z0I4_9ASTR